MKMFCHNGIIFVFTILAFAGCTVNTPKQTPTPAPVERHAYHGPENQYYYFTAAQVQRKKGNLDQAVVLLRKAIEHDPESFYLQRELATVYIQNKEDGSFGRIAAERSQRRKIAHYLWRYQAGSQRK
jgi:predicted Zn-dependent protease